MARKSQVSPFNISFLDILSCALGGLLFILIIYLLQSALQSSREEEARTAERLREEAEREALRAQKEEIEAELEALRARLDEKTKALEVRAAQSEEARRAYEEFQKIRSEIDRVDELQRMTELETSRLERKIEQARKEIETLTEQAEVKVVKFLPRGGGGGEGVSQVHRLAVVLEDPMIPIRRWRSDAPPELEEVIDTAVAREPENRFPDAARFIAALEPLAC